MKKEVRVLLLNETDIGVVVDVMLEMEKLGAPTIRANFDGETIYALEGSHRIVAAHNLGLTPNFVFVDFDAVIADHDIDCGGLTPGVAATVEQIFEATYWVPSYNGRPEYWFELDMD